MPHIQDIHERYGDQGLVVLAISYEDQQTVRAFMQKSGYTLRAGCDPQKTVIGAYGVRSYPQSVLLDREGDIAWKGSPYGAEAAVCKELGLDLEPGKLLSAALKRNDKESWTRLVHRAPARFDMKKWALALKFTPLPEGRTPPKLKTAKALEALCKGNQPAGHALAADGDEAFDLGAWARARFAKQYPLKRTELKVILKKRHYRTAIDALVRRKSSGGVIGTAASNKEFRRYCASRFADRRVMARKGIMCRHWTLGRRQPTDNDGFFRDLSVSGFMTNKDRHVVGVLLGGEGLRLEQLPEFIDRNLTQHFLMKAIAERDKVSSSKIQKQVRRESAAILRELKQKYGWAEPFPEKK